MKIYQQTQKHNKKRKRTTLGTQSIGQSTSLHGCIVLGPPHGLIFKQKFKIIFIKRTKRFFLLSSANRIDLREISCLHSIAARFATSTVLSIIVIAIGTTGAAWFWRHHIVLWGTTFEGKRKWRKSATKIHEKKRFSFSLIVFSVWA